MYWNRGLVVTYNQNTYTKIKINEIIHIKNYTLISDF
jgi:hypothetical protein